MAKLYCTTKSNSVLLVSDLQVAESFWARAKGLLGRQELADNEALWIRPCNNIHTFFMKFKIDCIFINQKYVVTHIVKEIPAFRVIGPFWKAHSVIETSAGFIDRYQLQVGDQLYVVS